MFCFFILFSFQCCQSLFLLVEDPACRRWSSNCVMAVRRVHKRSAVMLLVIVSLLLIIGNIPLKIKISNRSKDLFSEESTTAEDGMDKNGLDLDKICPTDGGRIRYEDNLPKINYRPSTRRQFFKSRLCMYGNTSCCITCQLQSDSSVYRILLSGDIFLNPGPVR